MFWKIFSPNFRANIGAFCSSYCYFCKICIITLVFKKKLLFSENWQKSQKIVIITLTPGVIGSAVFPAKIAFVALPVFPPKLCYIVSSTFPKMEKSDWLPLPLNVTALDSLSSVAVWTSW
jgi:hypothetical protein